MDKNKNIEKNHLVKVGIAYRKQNSGEAKNHVGKEVGSLIEHYFNMRRFNQPEKLRTVREDRVTYRMDELSAAGLQVFLIGGEYSGEKFRGIANDLVVSYDILSHEDEKSRLSIMSSGLVHGRGRSGLKKEGKRNDGRVLTKV